MANHKIKRREILQGGAALTGALLVGNRQEAQAHQFKERPTLVVLWLNGGPAGLFNSANSFLKSGAFGVTENNIRYLGNDLYVDADSFGALPQVARSHMASINFRHGITRPHEYARAAVLETLGHSQLLRIAGSMPGENNRCVVINDLGLPKGVTSRPAPVNGISLEHIVDVEPVKKQLGARQFDEVRAAYSVPGENTSVRDLRSTFSAVELMIHANASVIFAQPAYTGRTDRQFDTHDDDVGVAARAVMAPITPSLSLFLDRTLGLPERNIVVMLVGEFSRTIPNSDHEPGGTATIIGKYVKTGTAGPQQADGAPPVNAPPPEALWAFLSSALHIDAAPFGHNPHPELIIRK